MGKITFHSQRLNQKNTFLYWSLSWAVPKPTNKTFTHRPEVCNIDLPLTYSYWIFTIDLCAPPHTHTHSHTHTHTFTDTHTHSHPHTHDDQVFNGYNWHISGRSHFWLFSWLPGRCRGTHCTVSLASSTEDGSGWIFSGTMQLMGCWAILSN